MADEARANGQLKIGTMAVGTTATAIPSVPLKNRMGVVVYNNGTGVLHIGGSDVTTSTGIPVAASGSISFSNLGNSTIYGVAVGAATVRVLEIAEY